MIRNLIKVKIVYCILYFPLDVHISQWDIIDEGKISRRLFQRTTQLCTHSCPLGRGLTLRLYTIYVFLKTVI